jgi:hypothetical protein
MSISIPNDQIIYNTKIYQRENSKNIEDPKIYLTKFINNLLKAFSINGISESNKVIGCDPFFVDLTPENIFRIVITPGTLIIDSALVEFMEPFFLDISLNSFLNYDEILVVASNKPNSVKSKTSFQLILRSSVTGELTSNSNLIITPGVPYLILGRFKLKRINDKIINIIHPYGKWTNVLYSDFLKHISPLAIPISNEIFQKLKSDATLYSSFLINNLSVKMTVPLFFDTIFEDDTILFIKINQHYINKMYQRYKIPDLFRSYYSMEDRNLQFRTEMFDAEYSYAI